MYHHDPKNRETLKLVGNPKHCGFYFETHEKRRGLCPFSPNHRTRPAWSAGTPGWMSTTCSNAIDSLNTRLVTSIGTASQMVKKPNTGVG
ncbi:hypothetical protein TNCV_2814131 [Trichonephila clavipes]|nr:hypothetical protein TNCV_2814131 [Trichonephila clavipes]